VGKVAATAPNPVQTHPVQSKVRGATDSCHLHGGGAEPIQGFLEGLRGRSTAFV
jgi:hypothetical protein